MRLLLTILVGLSLSGCAVLEKDLTNFCTNDGAKVAPLLGDGLQTDFIAACADVGVVVQP